MLLVYIQKYMINKIFLILNVISISLCSCSSYKQFIAQKSEVIPGKKIKFKINENDQICLPVILDNKQANFLFDTGCSGTLIFDYKNLIDSNRVIYGTKKYYQPDNTIFSTHKTILNLNLGFIKLENKVVSLTEKSFDKKSLCTDKKSDFQGIIGTDLFNLSDKTSRPILLISFSDSTISSLYNNFLEKNIGFQLLDGFFDFSSSLYLNLKVGKSDKKQKFLFDTGCSSTILTTKNNSNLNNSTSIDFEGAVVRLFTDYNNSKSSFYNDSVYFSNFELYSTINSIENFNTNIIGIQPIKNFDWIIDYRNKRVFCKPNSLNLNLVNEYDVVKGIRYLAEIIENKIIVIAINKNNQKIKVGDEIISIDGVKVTSENICDLLNKIYKNPNVDVEIFRK